MFMNLLTGEIVTIEFTDGLYVTLSNSQTVPYLEFIKNYKRVDI